MSFPDNNAVLEISKIQYNASVIRRMAVQILATTAQSPIYPETIREFINQAINLQTLIDSATSITNLNDIAQSYFADVLLDYASEVQSVAALAFSAAESVYGVLPKGADGGENWLLWERYDTTNKQFIPRGFTTIPAGVQTDLNNLINAIPATV